MLTLVIGGARSGKSRFAQSLCGHAARVAYLATAREEDAEMAERIRRHREGRPADWVTIEEPLEIARALDKLAAGYDVVLLDCLTLWLSNFCREHQADPPAAIESAALREVAQLAAASAAVNTIVVTNEVGAGLVPEMPLGRFFRDIQGWVNQEAARRANAVYYMVAGIPLTIKKAEGEQDLNR